MKHLLAKVVLGPILLAQGRYVRATVPILPEPPGPREGVDGDGYVLRLLVLGDSAAAGVGTDSQSTALSGQLVRCLAPRFTVCWKLLARTGSTTDTTLFDLEALPAFEIDAVVVSLGVNDVTSGLSPAAWIERQARLVELLRSRFAARQILLSGLPPVHHFPALPQPLRWYLGAQAKRFDQHLESWVAQQADCDFVRPSLSFAPDLMASDGFHPGPAVYEKWAQAHAQAIDRRWAPSREVAA